MSGRLPWIVLLPVLVFVSACNGSEEPQAKVVSQPIVPSAMLANQVEPAQNPDIVVTGKFESGAAKLEVLGICELSEDQVECWTPAGKKDADLSSKVSNALKPVSLSSGITGAYTMHYGMKNRMVIFKSAS
jgi:hypothetical protein